MRVTMVFEKRRGTIRLWKCRKMWNKRFEDRKKMWEERIKRLEEAGEGKDERGADQKEARDSMMAARVWSDSGTLYNFCRG
jgi:hypothetical protein